MLLEIDIVQRIANLTSSSENDVERDSRQSPQPSKLSVY
jgi:hypothetical protein